MTGLGRLFIPDKNDHKYLLPRAKSLRTSRHWMSLGPVLDQGNTSECVIYSGDKYLTTHPVINKTFGSAERRTRIYREVQKLDQWPGENYEGTSVRALFKWLKREGRVSEYRWALDVQTAIAHLLDVGPMVFGTDWTLEMFRPDRWGYIKPEGPVEGGHAYLGIGVSLRRKNPDGTVGAIRILNSWGPNWGPDRGRAWITIADMDRLIRSDGEACCATELRPAA